MSAPRRSRQGGGLGESPTYLIPDGICALPALIPLCSAQDDPEPAICHVRQPLLDARDCCLRSPTPNGAAQQHLGRLVLRTGGCVGERP